MSGILKVALYEVDFVTGEPSAKAKADSAIFDHGVVGICSDTCVRVPIARRQEW